MPAKWDRSRGSPEPIAALNRIIEIECGEPLVDIRQACPSVKIERPQVIPFLRETVARMLEEAAQCLPSGFRLSTIECWRPIARQQRIYDWHWEAMKQARPGLCHATMRRLVNRFVAPADQKAPPGHCTGAAVDVLLVDSEGNQVDVTSPFERFEAAPTFTLGLSKKALANRMILVEAMLEAGFSNCRDEYWHYSWGDAAWAVRTGRRECCYGLIEMPLEEYYEQELLWLEAYRDRKNPYLKAD